MFKSSFLLFIMFMWNIAAQAQVVVTTPYPVAAQSITSALNSSLLTVEVQFNTACSSPTVTVSFPASVTYIPGSVALVASASGSGFAIAEGNISNTNKPVFNLTVPATGSLRFTLLRKAGCGAPANGKDTIRVNSSCGAATENSALNSYPIQTPALSMVPPVVINSAVLGQTATRSITVNNGGNGCTDTLRFYVIYPSGGIANTNTNQLSIGGTGFAPWRSSGDTLFYKFYGPVLFGGDHLLCNGETVTISEPVKILKCNAMTIYRAYWGIGPDNACGGANGNASISMASGTANFSASPVTTNVGYTNLCTPWTQTASFTNSGTGNAVAASMYNVKVGVEANTGGNIAGNLNFTFSAFNVNGHPLTVSGSNTTIYTIDLDNMFTSDPDGAGGLEDIDGDGYYDDLKSGSTFVLKWTTQALCNLACGNDFIYNIGFRLSYKSMCGLATVSSSIKTGSISVSETGGATNSYLPANIIGGQPFRFQFRSGFNTNNNPLFTANGRYQYRLVLPAGVSVAPAANAKYGTANATYTQSGDTLIITSPSNTLDTAGINLVFNCGTGGNLNFWHSLVKVNDIGNNCTCSGVKFCATVTTLAHCPAPCLGVTSSLPVVRRVDNCLGWTNHTLTTKQSAANISAYDLSKALYLDTIQISSSALQNTLSNNLHARLSLAKTSLAPLNVKKLSPVDMQVSVWRLGIQVFSCTQTVFADSSTTSMQEIDWDLCAPAGGFLPGDSIYTLSRYVVATNAGLPQQDVQSGSKWYYYNKVGTQMNNCGTWIPEMYLVGTSVSSFPNTMTVNGCTTISPLNNITRRFGTSGVLYANEFRPVIYIDSIVFTKTAGYNYISAAMSKYAGPLNTPQVTVPLVPNSVNGNVYTYINPGNWPFLGLVKATSYSGAFIPTVSSNCATQATESFVTKIYIRDYLYAFGGDPAQVPATYRYIYHGNTSANIASGTGLSYALDYIANSKPNLVVQNTTGIVQGIKPNHYWDVKVSNTSTSAAGYVWLALEQGAGSGGIQVDSITDLSTNTILSTEGAYACTGVNGYNWYKFSTAGITSGAEANFRVHFRYASCSKDSVLLKAGWSCSSFPATSPCTYSCAATQVYLTVDPQPSQLQLSMVRQPGNGLATAMCATDSTIFLINNAQAAYLSHPYVTVYPPAGVTINTPIPVEYPVGSNIWYNINPVSLPGGGYEIPFSSIAALSGGFPGTITNPGTAARQAKIKLAYTSSCSTVSGTAFECYGYGERSCGGPAIGDGIMLQSQGVHLTGASASGSMTLSLSTTSTGLACKDTLVLQSMNTLIGAGTQIGDTVVYTLPPGLDYAGNFVSVTNCDACQAITDNSAAGNTVVKVVMSPGIPANAQIVYHFKITPEGEGCGSLPVNVYAKRQIGGLSCGMVPCASSAAVIGEASLNLNINKPDITINHLQMTAGSWTVDSTVTVSATITNIGNMALPANNYYFEFFCGNSGVPFATEPFPYNVGIGQTVTGAMTFAIPDNYGCTSGVTVTGKLRPLTTSGTQCLCSASEYTIAVPLPVTLNRFEGNMSHCTANLEWEVTEATGTREYIVEYSTDGNTFSSIGTLASSGSRLYFFQTQQKHNRVYYRLKIKYDDGSFEYSDLVVLAGKCTETQEVSIYPNPVDDLLYVNTNKHHMVIAQLFNVLGKKVLERVLQEGEGVIDVHSLPEGIYELVLMESGGNYSTSKVRIR